MRLLPTAAVNSVYRARLRKEPYTSGLSLDETERLLIYSAGICGLLEEWRPDTEADLLTDVFVAMREGDGERTERLFRKFETYPAAGAAFEWFLFLNFRPILDRN